MSPAVASWAETTPQRNTALPIERSISDMVMRMATPDAMTARMALWRSINDRLRGVRKSPRDWRWK
jgi:hypothetical protein